MSLTNKQKLAVRMWQLCLLMEFMQSSQPRLTNPANEERARKLWLAVINLPR